MLLWPSIHPAPMARRGSGRCGSREASPAAAAGSSLRTSPRAVRLTVLMFTLSRPDTSIVLLGDELQHLALAVGGRIRHSRGPAAKR